MTPTTLIDETGPWKDLKAHVDDIKKTHLRELMSDAERCQSMIVHDNASAGVVPKEDCTILPKK